LKIGARSPWPEQSAAEEARTWEEVFSDDPALSTHVSEKLHGLQSAGYFMTDFRRLSGGIQLDISKDDALYKINLYAGKDGRINVVPSGKKSKELSAIARLLAQDFDVKQSLPETERELKKWLGTDEAGKGDYFGPLVVGGFLADWEVAGELESMGIRESKGLTKRRVLGLARLLWGKYKKRCAVVELRPERYNQLYEDFRGGGGKLNRLLGWAHARVIQDIHSTSSVNAVVIDRFGKPEDITRYLKKLPRVELMFRARAESNPAVAAASILAKARFFERLDKLSEEVDLELPPGAGAQVVTAARGVVEKHGPAALRKVAKLHFKTTEQVMQQETDQAVGRSSP
jgi:ribonuclease HIII